MKDYIERASVHSIIEQTFTITFTRGRMHEQVDSLPAADVAPVVRCRECARAEESVHPNTVVCVEHGKTMLESDFCSYGEKAN